MIKVVVEIDIDRSSEEVFTYISNFENNPSWQSGQIEARFTSEGPLGVGSTYDQVAKFMGRRIESSFEVIEFEPHHMVKATTTAGSFPITFTRIVEPAGSAARVTAVVEGDASGFFKLAQPLLARIVQRSVNSDYQNLKQILEGRE